MKSMKPFMPVSVNDRQGAFVHGRSIFDNILVSHEISHSMKGKRLGYVSYVGNKLDMSKACFGFFRLNGFFFSKVVYCLFLFH